MLKPLIPAALFLIGLLSGCGSGGGGDDGGGDGGGGGGTTVVETPINLGLSADASVHLRTSYANEQRYWPDPRTVIGVLPGFRNARVWHDFDGDGRLDLVVANGNGSQAEPVLQLGGSGMGERVSVAIGGAPTTLHARKALLGDLNGDGAMDVFLADHGDDFTFVGHDQVLLMNDGAGALTARPVDARLFGYRHSAALGDVDNDGDLDLLLTGQQYPSAPQGRHRLMLNQGDGTFTVGDERLPSRIFAANRYTSEFFDLDGDGFLDLFIAGDDPDQAGAVYWGSASGAYRTANRLDLPVDTIMTTILDAEAEDVDGDGRRDLLLLRTVGRSIPLAYGHYYEGRTIQVLHVGADRSLTDITAGAMPLLPYTAEPRIGTIRLAHGDTAYREAISRVVYWLKCVDMDGDGDRDVVLCTDRDGNYVLVNDGAGHFAPAYLANDDFAHAEVLAGLPPLITTDPHTPATTYVSGLMPFGSNCGPFATVATLEAGETPTANGTVWYSYTPEVDGLLSLASDRFTATPGGPLLMGVQVWAGATLAGAMLQPLSPASTAQWDKYLLTGGTTYRIQCVEGASLPIRVSFAPGVTAGRRAPVAAPKG